MTPKLIYKIKYPEYEYISNRINSFRKWPHNHIEILDLAEAGFFYTSFGDNVICFSCGTGIKDWTIYVKPWEAHALLEKNCGYLRENKTEEFIEDIKNMQETNYWFLVQ